MDSYYCGSGKFSYPLYSLSMKQRITPVNPLNSSLGEIKMHAVKGIKSSRIPKILLIDDELDDLFVLEKLLIHGGFEVKSFSSPREALRHYANGDPSSYDLVISDIRMPEINGFQLYSCSLCGVNLFKISSASEQKLAVRGLDLQAYTEVGGCWQFCCGFRTSDLSCRACGHIKSRCEFRPNRSPLDETSMWPLVDRQ